MNIIEPNGKTSALARQNLVHGGVFDHLTVDVTIGRSQ
jgi:hypothetical protein